VLQAVRTIPAGTVWTYGQMARAIGKPQASRAVGQALGRNPVPVVVPCHRVIAGDGSLGGYSGGGGLASKRLLLDLEGALPDLGLGL
jgi:methylated-DNA-[protein]-cysteine S-methyltransferase